MTPTLGSALCSMCRHMAQLTKTHRTTANHRYEGDVEDLCLDFTVEYEAYGRRVTEVRGIHQTKH